jgi:hypothetical protein
LSIKKRQTGWWRARGRAARKRRSLKKAGHGSNGREQQAGMPATQHGKALPEHRQGWGRLYNRRRETWFWLIEALFPSTGSSIAVFHEVPGRGFFMPKGDQAV